MTGTKETQLKDGLIALFKFTNTLGSSLLKIHTNQTTHLTTTNNTTKKQKTKNKKQKQKQKTKNKNKNKKQKTNKKSTRDENYL